MKKGILGLVILVMGVCCSCSSRVDRLERDVAECDSMLRVLDDSLDWACSVTMGTLYLRQRMEWNMRRDSLLMEQWASLIDDDFPRELVREDHRMWRKQLTEDYRQMCYDWLLFEMEDDPWRYFNLYSIEDSLVTWHSERYQMMIRWMKAR